MASLEDWDLERYRQSLRQRASRLRLDARVLVRFGESDLVQETLLRAASAGEPPAATTDRERLAWLEQIQDNLLIDKHREHFAAKRDVRREEHLNSLRQALLESTVDHIQGLADSSPSPAEKAQGRELERLADEAIDQLPPSQRDVLRLRKEGLKFEEIADRLSITRPAAQGHYRRGLEALRRRFAGEGDHA
jgi:RNA polymerase sigma-70 factor (subfamily 1)